MKRGRQTQKERDSTVSDMTKERAAIEIKRERKT